ncbi:MAG: LemA family protein, partial [Burkholderiales bacterium]|nr:LemA family protein [Burkholderiales bacterium]
ATATSSRNASSAPSACPEPASSACPVEQRPVLAAIEPLGVLQESAQRIGFARQLFNDAVHAYNEAVRQFPTRLLTRLFGFGAAGTL